MTYVTIVITTKRRHAQSIRRIRYRITVREL
jgi:hypothetical protein